MSLIESIGFAHFKDIIEEVDLLDEDEQIEFYYLIALSNYDELREYIHINKHKVTTLIKLIKNMCFSKYTYHKMIVLDLTVLMIKEKGTFDQLSDDQQIFIRNKVKFYTTDSNIIVVKKAIDLIIKYKIYADEFIFTLSIDLFKSDYESNRVQGVKLIMLLNSDKVKYLVDLALKDESFRIRYNLLKIINEIKCLETRNKIIKQLQNDKVEFVREKVYLEIQFYRANNETEIKKVLAAIFTIEKRSSLESKINLIRNCVKYTKIFKDRNMIERYLINGTWHIKQCIFDIGEDGFDYINRVIEMEISVECKNYEKQLDILNKIEQNKILLQESDLLNKIKTNLLKLLMHQVHAVRIRASDIFLNAFVEFNLNKAVKNSKGTVELVHIKRSKKNAWNCSFFTFEHVNYLKSVKNHHKHQIRDDAHNLIKKVLKD